MNEQVNYQEGFLAWQRLENSKFNDVIHKACHH